MKELEVGLERMQDDGFKTAHTIEELQLPN